jgi:5-methylcytosine-specific restriction endonuclease McrA
MHKNPNWDINNGQTLCSKCHNKTKKQTLDLIRRKK